MLSHAQNACLCPYCRVPVPSPEARGSHCETCDRLTLVQPGVEKGRFELITTAQMAFGTLGALTLLGALLVPVNAVWRAAGFWFLLTGLFMMLDGLTGLRSGVVRTASTVWVGRSARLPALLLLLAGSCICVGAASIIPHMMMSA